MIKYGDNDYALTWIKYLANKCDWGRSFIIDESSILPLRDLRFDDIAELTIKYVLIWLIFGFCGFVFRHIAYKSVSLPPGTNTHRN